MERQHANFVFDSLNNTNLKLCTKTKFTKIIILPIFTSTVNDYIFTYKTHLQKYHHDHLSQQRYSSYFSQPFEQFHKPLAQLEFW